jgi:hypothetical protein
MRRSPTEHLRRVGGRAFLVSKGVHPIKGAVSRRPPKPPVDLASTGGDAVLYPVPAVRAANRPSLFAKLKRSQYQNATAMEYDPLALGGYEVVSFMRKIVLFGQEGKIYVRERYAKKPRVVAVGPGGRLDTRGRLNRADLRGLNLAGGSFSGSTESTNMANSVFDEASLTSGTLANTSLDGASFKGARLENLLLLDVSARGADFTGATFTSVKCDRFDVRDSNLTADQAADLAGASNGYGSLVYDQYTIDEACQHLGIDEDTFGVMVWAGDLQVIAADGRATNETFDRTCHVPQWEIHRLTTAMNKR